MNTVAENGKTIFLQTLDLPSPQDRQKFLDAACAGDSQLRQEVEQLLAHHEQAGEFLESPPTELVAAGRHDTTPDAAAPELDFLAPATGGQALGRLGYYDILEVIGSGGFGVVLKARDSKLDRIVAIKTLTQALASSATARQRFVREAKAAAAVNHEYVVDIHAVAEDGPVPYLVMEYVHGVSLDERLKQSGAPDLRAILRIGMKIAAGLAAAHQQGLVHRDVKPANILLQNGVERVKITDFGLARTVDDITLTQTGIIAGTPAYMSPEQAHGEAVDHRSDLFSLGSVLYALCTGRSPFRAETTMATLRRVCDDAPRPIREVNPDIPDWLAQIISRLLAKNPTERFQSADEVADLLGQHLAQLQHPAPAPLESTTLSQSKIQNPKSKIPNRWAIAAAALVLLLIGISLTEATGVTRFAPTVMRIVTGKGTLVVEVNDPAVKVTVEGDGGLVITGAGLHEVHLKPGKYQLRADKDGQRVSLDQDLVTITRGREEVVRVRLEATPAVAAADRSLTPTAEGFTPLFNGKELTGWAAAGGGTGMWKIEDGALTCTGPRDHLLTTRNDFGDFHLRAEVKINAHGNSGIYFRASKPLVLVGDYEAQITDNPGQQYKTGSLYGLVRLSESPVPPETWFTLDVIAEGKRIRILVNGTQTADYTDNRAGRNSKGHIALQHHDPETRVFFRNVEIRELPPATPVANGAFVLLGVAERKFDTLADAVYAANNGDTIEVRGNGPYVSEPIDCGQTALHIRAGAGFRPIIKMRPEASEKNVVLLATSAALVLEGLEFQRARPKKEEQGIRIAVHCADAQLWAANCRFNAPVFSARASRCVFRNCDFLGTGWGVGGNRRSGSTFIFENCLHRDSAAFQIGFSFLGGLPRAASIQIRRNTFASNKMSLAWTHTSPLSELTIPADAAVGMDIDVAESVFDVQGVLGVEQGGDLETTVEPAEAVETLKRLVRWRGERNLFAGGRPLLAWSAGWKLLPSHGPQTLEEWKRFWNTTESGSLEGRVQFQGGNLASWTNLDRLTPDDFRLREGGPGHRALPGGQDLGADMDLVGPGPAYEHWKKTPEYQTWLKDTGQQRDVAAAAKRETGAFVVLGGAGVTERKFDTLAEAVQNARDDDTIEIRGNGPYVIEPITVGSQSLILRAGAGCRPVLKPSQLKVPMLELSGRLVLEGIDFEVLGHGQLDASTTLILNQGPLFVANCSIRYEHQGKFWFWGLGAHGARNCTIRNCFFAGQMSGFGCDKPLLSGTCSVENCILAGNTMTAGYDRSEIRDLTFRLQSNTIVRQDFGVIAINPRATLDLAKYPKPIRVEASGNVFDSAGAFTTYPYPADVVTPLERTEAEDFLRRLVDWREQVNVYAGDATAIYLDKSKDAPFRMTLAEWNEFWGAADSQSLSGTIRFAGGNLRQKLSAPGQRLTPEDFRLSTDSAGYGAGKDGKDLGADVDLVGPGAAYERWKKTPEYQEWLKETGQLRAEMHKPETNAFMLLGGKGVAERKFDTLAEAVLAASDGDTIEIRGNGPFVTRPITSGNQRLTLRAAAGYRPIVQFSRDSGSHQSSLFAGTTSLTLEGLEFRSPPPGPDDNPFAFVAGMSLHAANCRFLVPQTICVLSGNNTRSCVLRNCEILNCRSAVAGDLASGGNWLVDNCVQLRGHALDCHWWRPDYDNCSLQLTRCTYAGTADWGFPINLYGTCKLEPAQTPKVVQLGVSGCVLDCKPVLIANQNKPSTDKDQPLSPQDFETHLQNVLKWRGGLNVYRVQGGPADRLLLTGTREVLDAPHGPADLAAWREFWRTPETGSFEGRARFEGANLIAKLETAPHQLTPDDFRLRPDSAGYRAGPGGKDLGADVDLVGPGAAYERWKKTPEYQQWLKETRQLP